MVFKGSVSNCYSNRIFLRYDTLTTTIVANELRIQRLHDIMKFTELQTVFIIIVGVLVVSCRTAVISDRRLHQARGADHGTLSETAVDESSDVDDDRRHKSASLGPFTTNDSNDGDFPTKTSNDDSDTEDGSGDDSRRDHRRRHHRHHRHEQSGPGRHDSLEVTTVSTSTILPDILPPQPPSWHKGQRTYEDDDDADDDSYPECRWKYVENIDLFRQPSRLVEAICVHGGEEDGSASSGAELLSTRDVIANSSRRHRSRSPLFGRRQHPLHRRHEESSRHRPARRCVEVYYSVPVARLVSDGDGERWAYEWQDVAVACRRAVSTSPAPTSTPAPLTHVPASRHDPLKPDITLE